MSMKTLLCTLALSVGLLSNLANAQNAYDFFRGEAFPAPRATPAAWLAELHKADELLGSNIAVAEFLPNTKLAWHHHPGGQILIITDGVGYYQEKGQPRQIVRIGDVIKCAPGVVHWHGAAVESAVTYVAISPAQKGGTVWAEAVTDGEYKSPAIDRRTPRAVRKADAASLIELSKADSTFPFNIISATFAPGKRLDWHKDGGGQILIFTDGSGYFQERGQPKQLVRKGDIVKSAAGVEHWHGAAAEIGTTHIAITPLHESGTKWLEKVSDKEYAARATPFKKATEQH
jgi:quercetin dioxygenase-like cupin family protein